MRVAWKSYPHFHKMIFRKFDAKPVRAKTEALKNTGMYLTRSKATAKLVCEYLNGEIGSKNDLSKRDRGWEMVDVLGFLKFFWVVGNVWGGNEANCKSVAVAVLSVFTSVDTHYTYTLVAEGDANEELDITDDLDLRVDDTGDVLDQETDDLPRFAAIS